MSLEYRVDKANGVVLVVGSDKVTQHDFVDQVAKQLSDPEYSQKMNTIYDLRECRFEGTHEKLKELAARMTDANLIREASKTAIITSRTMEYGLARQYSMIAGDSKVEYEVFDEPKEALRWLHLPKDYLQQKGRSPLTGRCSCHGAPADARSPELPRNVRKK